MAEIKLTGVRDQDYDNRAAFADSAQLFYGASGARRPSMRPTRFGVILPPFYGFDTLGSGSL